MRSLRMALTGLAVLAVFLALFSGPASAAQEAAVVTVGDATQGTRDSTLWGLATRYMPDETRNKPSRALTDKEKNEIYRRLLALQLYHNALASERNQGRVITDRDLIFKGEKLYLPPQNVIDQIVGLLPENPSQGVTSARRDQLMRVVLRDVADNRDTIQRSKAGQNLTTNVLETAQQVAATDQQADDTIQNSDDTVGGAGVTPNEVAPEVLNEVVTQDLPDESPATDPVVLGPDGQPVSSTDTEGDSTVTTGSAGDVASTTGTDTGAPNLDVDLTARTSSLERLLESAEQAANDPSHPRRQYFRDLAARIRAELERRKVEEARQQAGQGNTTPTTVASADINPQGPNDTANQVVTPTTGNDGPETTQPEDTEYVPDWYLKALQEWNLQQYWQSKGDKAKAGNTGKRKMLDPLTGKEVEQTDADPFGQFTDELTNYEQNEGVVQKRTGN